MEFSQRIKSLRKEKNLTQEQLAQSLHVSRQAVSNWENNRNLPDIEMLIQISSVFDVSLDELLTGKELKEKIIVDGNESRRAKMNLISTIIGGCLILLGFIFIFIKACSVEYIDEMGFLHENFFLLPMAFFSMFTGLLIIFFTGILTWFRNKRYHNSQKEE
ncbi:helix-turn-helix domain-containing protein [Floccifex sp.]|uniref:helix-turn-helix domain-containing protein n=1 Tax=Floccifex sp. TaxID=2815810 RepID=UPI003EFED071